LWRPLCRSRSLCRPLLSERRHAAGLWAPRNRTAHQSQIAQTGRGFPSVLVGAIGAAGAAARAGDPALSAADHPGRAGWLLRFAAGWIAFAGFPPAQKKLEQ